MFSVRRLLLFAVVVLVLGSCWNAWRHTATFYRRISLDPSSLVVTFHDPIATTPEPRTDFYWPFYDSGGGCSVNHFDTTSQPHARARCGSFELDPQHRLVGRSKEQVLLETNFGTFYAESRYYYAGNYGTMATMFLVRGAGSSIESEAPSASSLPISAEARLSMVSVLRVVKNPAGYALVSACYTPDGTFLNLSENQWTDGDCRSGGSTTFDLARSQPEKFGLPRTFPVNHYTPDKPDFLPPSTLVSEMDCVSFHYDQNQRVRQDLFRSGQLSESRTLNYKITVEDSVLAKIDASHPYDTIPRPPPLPTGRP